MGNGSDPMTYNFCPPLVSMFLIITPKVLRALLERFPLDTLFITVMGGDGWAHDIVAQHYSVETWLFSQRIHSEL